MTILPPKTIIGEHTIQHHRQKVKRPKNNETNAAAVAKHRTADTDRRSSDRKLTAEARQPGSHDLLHIPESASQASQRRLIAEVHGEPIRPIIALPTRDNGIRRRCPPAGNPLIDVLRYRRRRCGGRTNESTVNRQIIHHRIGRIDIIENNQHRLIRISYMQRHSKTPPSSQDTMLTAIHITPRQFSGELHHIIHNKLFTRGHMHKSFRTASHHPIVSQQPQQRTAGEKRNKP